MFLFILGISILGFLAAQGVMLPEWFPTCLHGMCPFGGVVTLGRLFTQGLYIPKTGLANLVALSASLFGTVLFGACFCGWLCPLGSLQDWVGGFSRKFRRGLREITKTKEEKKIFPSGFRKSRWKEFPHQGFFLHFGIIKGWISFLHETSNTDQ